MNVILIIIAMICVSIETACIVSLYYDYKAGNRKVRRTVKNIRRKAKKVLHGVLCGIGYFLLTAPFAIWFVYSYATM